MATRAPSRAKVRAIGLPIPLAATVTRAALSLSRIVFLRETGRRVSGISFGEPAGTDKPSGVSSFVVNGEHRQGVERLDAEFNVGRALREGDRGLLRQPEDAPNLLAGDGLDPDDRRHGHLR